MGTYVIRIKIYTFFATPLQQNMAISVMNEIAKQTHENTVKLLFLAKRSLKPRLKLAITQNRKVTPNYNDSKV